ncbi:retrovirus-related pol polyprotein from transposon TNT 1-94 [Tanacetum coccineum]
MAAGSRIVTPMLATDDMHNGDQAAQKCGKPIRKATTRKPITGKDSTTRIEEIDDTRRKHYYKYMSGGQIPDVSKCRLRNAPTAQPLELFDNNETDENWNDTVLLAQKHSEQTELSRSKKPQEVPTRTRKPKRKANKSIATPPKKTVASKSTIQKSKSYYRMLYEKTSKAWKWWIEQKCPSGYKWVPKTKMKWVPKVRNKNVKKRVSFAIDNVSRITNVLKLTNSLGSNLSSIPSSSNSLAYCMVRFGNDQFALILGYGYLVQGNIMINRVYYVEGLNHNLFSVGQFCDADLEVAFQKSMRFVRDLQGNYLLTVSPTQAWLWHRRLSHLNFDYINLLSQKDVVIGLPKLKYVKDPLCSSCEVSKAKKKFIQDKDEYFRYTWTLFLRSNDETPEVLKDFLTMIQRNLQAPVILVRTDRSTEFLNKTLHAFFKEEGIEHQTSTPRTPEQNGVVAEAIETACYTQNRSIIIPTHEKMAYHIINDRQPSIKHLHIFGCTCYLTRDGENLDKMKEKGDPCILMSETSVDNNTPGLVPQRQKASDYDNSDPAPQLQNVSPLIDTTDPSQQELDLLFGPLYDEFFNAGTLSVNNSSSPTDYSKQQDTPTTMIIQSSTEPTTLTTTVLAEENNKNQVEANTGV